ncbi:hypothetical protein [[Micrococcus luteus] ATCC 49442]|uniref:hypothetical protein n=1 Tax=[Micrococcus luteus] ATCC 49442 TaxID=2698727 RepID=UPI0013D919E7|nr:hypothetical protein [[Micrococcus luteus] ATCC 49442]
MNSSTLPDAAPDGFVMAMDVVFPDQPGGYFDGPSESGDAWRIETTFTVERGVAFELVPLDAECVGAGLTAAQAIAAGEALARLAAKYA